MSPEKGGVLRTTAEKTFRRSLLLVAGAALIAAPFVALRPSTPATPPSLSAAPPAVLLAARVTPTTIAPRALMHRLAVTSARHKVAVARRRAMIVHIRAAIVAAATARLAPVTTTTGPPAPPTTRPPVTTTTKPAPVDHDPPPANPHHRIGLATWYSWHPGQCATSYLPKGTLITVRDLATGRSIQCLVTDHQAYNPARVVDLSETQFAELAPLSQGVVRVEVTW